MSVGASADICIAVNLGGALAVGLSGATTSGAIMQIMVAPSRFSGLSMASPGVQAGTTRIDISVGIELLRRCSAPGSRYAFGPTAARP
jgi:hypothetical protein